MAKLREIRQTVELYIVTPNMHLVAEVSSALIGFDNPFQLEPLLEIVKDLENNDPMKLALTLARDNAYNVLAQE